MARAWTGARAEKTKGRWGPASSSALGMSAGCRRAGTAAPASASCARQVSPGRGCSTEVRLGLGRCRLQNPGPPKGCTPGGSHKSQMHCSLALSHAPWRTNWHGRQLLCGLTCGDRLCCNTGSLSNWEQTVAHAQLLLPGLYTRKPGGGAWAARNSCCSQSSGRWVPPASPEPWTGNTALMLPCAPRLLVGWSCCMYQCCLPVRGGSWTSLAGCQS